MIPVYKPYLPKYVRRFVYDAIDSTWISSQGKYLKLATEELKKILNIKHVLLTNTGTSATHLVAKSLKFKHRNIRTVLVPNNVYVAAWNSLLVDKHFLLRNTDTNKDTWNMNLKDIDKLQYNIEAVLIVHNLGNIVDVPSLIKKYPYLVFIEDNCEGFGGYYDGYPSGTKSICSAFSFFANKNITSGEGGAFVTNDESLYKYAKLIHGQGQSNKKFIHSVLGYNYRMTNIQAAILYGQLKIMDEIMSMKKNIFNSYTKKLKDVVDLQISDNNTVSANWMFGIRIKGNKSYEHIKDFFDKNGIETRPFFYPINYHTHLRSYWENMEMAKLLSKEIFILPSYPELSEKEIMYISEKVKEFKENYV